MARPMKLTHEALEKVIDDYESGTKWSECLSKSGGTRAAVYARMRQQPALMSRYKAIREARSDHRVTPHAIEAYLSARESGMGNLDAEKAAGVTYNAVLYHIKQDTALLARYQATLGRGAGRRRSLWVIHALRAIAKNAPNASVLYAQILVEIDWYPNRRAAIADIGERIGRGRDSSAVQDACRRMEEWGIVTREPIPGKLRGYIVKAM